MIARLGFRMDDRDNNFNIREGMHTGQLGSLQI